MFCSFVSVFGVLMEEVSKAIITYDIMDLSTLTVQRLATGLTIRGSNPGGVEIFHNRSERPWGPPSLLYNIYRVFFGGKGGRGLALISHPHLAPRLKKEQSYISTPTPSLRGLFQGDLYLYFTFASSYLASPYRLCSNPPTNCGQEFEYGQILYSVFLIFRPNVQIQYIILSHLSYWTILLRWV